MMITPNPHMHQPQQHPSSHERIGVIQDQRQAAGQGQHHSRAALEQPRLEGRPSRKVKACQCRGGKGSAGAYSTRRPSRKAGTRPSCCNDISVSKGVAGHGRQGEGAMGGRPHGNHNGNGASGKRSEYRLLGRSVSGARLRSQAVIPENVNRYGTIYYHNYHYSLSSLQVPLFMKALLIIFSQNPKLSHCKCDCMNKFYMYNCTELLGGAVANVNACLALMRPLLSFPLVAHQAPHQAAEP